MPRPLRLAWAGEADGGWVSTICFHAAHPPRGGWTLAVHPYKYGTHLYFTLLQLLVRQFLRFLIFSCLKNRKLTLIQRRAEKLLTVTLAQPALKFIQFMARSESAELN
jgi:hypothetical protein